MKRIPPSERIREEVEQFFREGITGNSEESITGMLLRLGAQRLVQEALEQEVTDFLGRGHYEHHGQETTFRGHRNGYEPGKMPTAEGAIPVYIPQTRRTPEPFHSTLLPFLHQNTEALNRLVLEK